MFRSETRFTYCAESFVDFASASRLRMRRLQPLCRGPSSSTIRNLTVFSEQGRPPKAAPVVCELIQRARPSNHELEAEQIVLDAPESEQESRIRAWTFA